MATNFGHIELITQNLDKAKDFYQKLFRLESPRPAGYALLAL